MTGLWQQGRDALQGFRILRVGLNPIARPFTHASTTGREMFSAGLLRNPHAARPVWFICGPLNSLGYKQATQHLRGELSLEQAIVAAQQGHRNYAKRQMTWFRRDLRPLDCRIWIQRDSAEQVVDLIKTKAQS